MLLVDLDDLLEVIEEVLDTEETDLVTLKGVLSSDLSIFTKDLFLLLHLSATFFFGFGDKLDMVFVDLFLKDDLADTSKDESSAVVINLAPVR